MACTKYGPQNKSSDWLDYFPKWMAGETGSGFEGIKSLIISDQIIINRLYHEELKHRSKCL